MSSSWIYATIGVIVGAIVLGVVAVINAVQTTHYLSLYAAIKDDLVKSEINKAEIEIRKVSGFGLLATGPPLCQSRIGEQYLILNSTLAAILEKADPDGESSRYVLHKDAFISIAKTLCTSEGWVNDNEDRSPQWYPGRIITNSGKYWYGIDIYWNQMKD